MTQTSLLFRSMLQKKIRNNWIEALKVLLVMKFPTCIIDRFDDLINGRQKDWNKKVELSQMLLHIFLFLRSGLT